MDLQLNIKLAENYKSNTQIARVLTEPWLKNNIYCPNCGAESLFHYEKNKPVADFYCNFCKEDFELKSKNNKFPPKIEDGAYSTMIERIASDNNPNFFFLTYNKNNWLVTNLIVIPKYFFTPEIIIKRKPLSPTAKRAGWIGCKIDISEIPETGKITFIKDSLIYPKNKILEDWHKTIFIKQCSHEERGWTLDILNCIHRIKSDEFKLTDVYQFETELALRHPNNNRIQAKIRQQLQVLRDKGIIEFKARGIYRKL